MATRNDITGDALISRVNSDAYRENFEKIFASKKKGVKDEQSICTGVLEQDATLATNEDDRTLESSD